MVYTITAFSDRGETLLDDTFDASSDSEARQQGIRRLKEADLEHRGARVTRSGQLIHFERTYLPRLVPTEKTS